MSYTPESSPTIPDFVDELVGMPLTSPDLWSDELTANEAPFVRQALIRAQGLRILQADPGDAYLQGIADTMGYQRMQRLVASLPIEIAQTITEPAA